MKYLLFFPLLLLGCIKPVAHGSYTDIKGYDFTSYAAEGFLFTPEPYNTASYEGMGIIFITKWPQVRKAQASYSTAPGYHTVSTPSAGYWYVEDIKSEDVIKSAYHTAKSLGADAIVRFDIKNVTRLNGELEETGIEVYGFAIKRK